jgi:hypothetical protein
MHDPSFLFHSYSHPRERQESFHELLMSFIAPAFFALAMGLLGHEDPTITRGFAAFLGAILMCGSYQVAL